MPESNRRLILGNGEQYAEPVETQSRGGPREMPRPYEAARDRAKSQLQGALTRLQMLPASKKLGDEAVLCFRLHPDVLAKTYDPKAVFALVPDLVNIGSRNYPVSNRDVAQTKRVKKQLEEQIFESTGRLVFVRSNDAGFRRLIQLLDRPEALLPREFREDIQRIETFNTLSAMEQLLGFAPDWVEGRVEIVLHPSKHSETEQSHFLKELFPGHDASRNRIRFASYPQGPLFASCYLTRSELNAVAGSNPLRTAHPFAFGGLERLRGAPLFRAPPPPNTRTRSTIKVGMFDGGIDPSHPHLNGYAEEDSNLSIKTTSDPELVEHGMAVAGVMLYGPLNERDTTLPLPEPDVSVVSFRALPTSDQNDIDLYESIDVIESAVPARPDLKVFNISFGPRGPILDDTISRFTYVLDVLAAKHNVLFFVAVGNDGEEVGTLGRIQAPADLVNGIGVGASTRRSGQNVRAPYSCRGPGRECAKIKPDLTAFGGCDVEPIHLVASTPGMKLLAQGTSFASPTAAALGARATESFDRGTPLLARALLTHTAKHPHGKPDHELGHGLLGETIDDVLRCGEDEVTVVFQGDLIPKRMVRLPVMLPPEISISGKIAVTWTIVALPPIDPNHPSDYTSCCIEDTFYPDSQTYRFSNPDKEAKPKHRELHLIKDSKTVRELEEQGWKRGLLPVSKTGNQYKTEDQLRAVDCKWEPIVRRSRSMMAASLNDPFLVLHAVPRNGASDRFPYAAVVTISAPKFKGDLYAAVLRRFSALQPIRLRTEAELRIQI